MKTKKQRTDEALKEYEKIKGHAWKEFERKVKEIDKE